MQNKRNLTKTKLQRIDTPTFKPDNNLLKFPPHILNTRDKK